MRILMFTPYFYPEGGGLERYAYEMAKEFSKSGHAVTILTLTRGQSKTESIGTSIRVIRVKPDFIVSNTPVGVKYVLLALRYGKLADVLVAHTPVPFAADVASFISFLYNKPLILVYHTVGYYTTRLSLRFISWMYSSTLEKFVLSKSTRIVAVSKIVQRYLQQKGYPSIICFPPLTLKIHSSDCTEKENIFLFVGQLGHYHRFKNLDVLIKAFARFKSKFNVDWKLAVVGGGDLVGYYRRLAKSLEVSEWVEFKGFLGKRAMREIYCKSKVLFLPSKFESFGMVVPEAMACGTVPVISSSVGSGILVNSKNGVKINVISIEVLSNVMQCIVINPKMLKKASFLSKRSIEKLKSKHFSFLKLLLN